MTLPATIHSGATYQVGTHGNQNGPFLLNGALYVFLSTDVFGASLRIRAYKSTDLGQTWAEVAAGTGPTSWAPLSQAGMHPEGATMHLWTAKTIATATVLTHTTFNATTDAFGTQTNAVTFAAAIGNITGAVTADGRHVVGVDGQTETVMGSSRRVIKFAIRSAAGVWSGPFDAAGSPSLAALTNTGPAYTFDITLFAILPTVSNKVLFMYQALAGTALRVRELNASNQFTAAPLDVTSVLSTYAVWGDFPGGWPITYLDNGTTKIAWPHKRSADTFLGVARCADANAPMTLANWSDATTGATGGVGTPPPGVIASDGGKRLFLWHHTTALTYDLRYTEDRGTGTWQPFVDWKTGATECRYASPRLVSADTIGVLYFDGLSGASNIPARYDEVKIALPF